ncbi:lanthionine synthetase C family protein [Myceligenerans halotolerans]
MNTTDIVLAIAEKLTNPSDVAEAAGTGVATLAQGLPGTALLHARLSHLDPEFEQAATAHWEQAARRAAQAEAFGGTYHELGGLAASLIIGTPYLPDPQMQQTVVARAVRWTSSYASHLADRQRAFLAAGGFGTPWHIYDVISGLAGVGRVLLAALNHGHREAEPGLHAALNALTTMLATTRGRRPGWWVDREVYSETLDSDSSGAANTGLAHGVAGPLALLAVACAAGFEVPRQREAMETAAGWLCRWRTNGEALWPTHLTGDELDADSALQRDGRSEAWCYGIPGISRALDLAGRALGNDELRAVAVEAMGSLSSRTERWDAEGPTLCHGDAGILQCAGSICLPVGQIARIKVQAAYSPALRFGVQHHEAGARLDAPGFLTGAAGVALALSEHTDLPAAPVITAWDALLLLS